MLARHILVTGKHIEKHCSFTNKIQMVEHPEKNKSLKIVKHAQ